MMGIGTCIVYSLQQDGKHNFEIHPDKNDATSPPLPPTTTTTTPAPHTQY